MEDLLGVLMVPMVFMVVVAPSGWCCTTAPRGGSVQALPTASRNSCRGCWPVPRRCRSRSGRWSRFWTLEVPGWRSRV